LFALGDNKKSNGTAVLKSSEGDEEIETEEIESLKFAPNDRVTSGVKINFKDYLKGVTAKHFLYNVEKAEGKTQSDFEFNSYKSWSAFIKDLDTNLLASTVEYTVGSQVVDKSLIASNVLKFISVGQDNTVGKQGDDVVEHKTQYNPTIET